MAALDPVAPPTTRRPGLNGCRQVVKGSMCEAPFTEGDGRFQAHTSECVTEQLIALHICWEVSARLSPASLTPSIFSSHVTADARHTEAIKTLPSRRYRGAAAKMLLLLRLQLHAAQRAPKPPLPSPAAAISGCWSLSASPPTSDELVGRHR